MRFALAMLVCGCVGFAATREAGIRRMGGARLAVCIGDDNCVLKPYCVQQARDFCADAGMEEGCAFGEPEFMQCGQPFVPEGIVERDAG